MPYNALKVAQHKITKPFHVDFKSHTHTHENPTYIAQQQNCANLLVFIMERFVKHTFFHTQSHAIKIKICHTHTRSSNSL